MPVENYRDSALNVAIRQGLGLRALWLFLYYSVVCHLPGPPLPGSVLARRIRTSLCRRIFRSVGKDVKIGKGVYIGSGIDVEFGRALAILRARTKAAAVRGGESRRTAARKAGARCGAVIVGPYIDEEEARLDRTAVGAHRHVSAGQVELRTKR